MIDTINREFYKLAHRKVAWLLPIIILTLMFILGISYGNSSEDGKFLFVSTYGSGQLIPLALVIVGSTFFSMEYQNNAILTLLYKSSNKVDVYVSKFIVLFIYDILIHILAIILTLIFAQIPLNHIVSFTEIYLYHQSLLTNMIVATLIDIAMSSLLISLVLLISCIINNNAIVTLFNIGIVFFGQGLSSVFLIKNYKSLKLVKWNPFNMLNITPQYYNYPVYHQTTHLTNVQLSIGTILYTLLFFIVGYLIFRKKRF